MIIEYVIQQIFGLLTLPSQFAQLTEFLAAIVTIYDYIDYFDSIIPVALIFKCSLLILTWTVICCIVRLVLYLA